jgi:hypothetical protein
VSAARIGDKVRGVIMPSGIIEERQTRTLVRTPGLGSPSTVAANLNWPTRSALDKLSVFLEALIFFGTAG